MSQENVEIVRASYAAYNAGDMVGAFAAVDPGIEASDHDIPDAPKSYRGLEGLARWQANFLPARPYPSRRRECKTLDSRRF